MLHEEVKIEEFGEFGLKPGQFIVTNRDLERPWSYLYTNKALLLKLNNYGPHSAQVNPPGGMLLFKTANNENLLPLQIFVNAPGQHLTAFLSPLNRDELLDYRCDFQPTHAEYLLTYRQLTIKTSIGIHDSKSLFWLRCELTNTGDAPVEFDILPVWRIHHASGALAPWDAPELYQSVGFFNDTANGIFVENRNPHGRKVEQIRSFLVTDLEISEAEVDYRKFTKSGGMLLPDMLDKRLSLPNTRAYSSVTPDERYVNIGTQGVAAMRSGRICLSPGEGTRFSLVLNHAATTDDSTAAIESAKECLRVDTQETLKRKQQETYDFWTRKLKVTLKDDALADYISNFLPLQLFWVGKLDRGWPTGMRGTRDASQDYSGIALVDESLSKNILLEILSCQKSDGGFFRQYSTAGVHGTHDKRDYVDSGCWVFELLYDYLKNSGDLGFLEEKCRTFDKPELSTVREHAERLLNYYLDKSNRGEHGLVLIHEGDWNDSLNTVGLEMRGESVMASCQVVFLMKLAMELFPEQRELWQREVDGLKQAIRAHALNGEGFLNGAFNDNGVWLFSDCDSDGRKRINSPVNSWGIIAGIFDTQEELDKVFQHLCSLKGPCGYRLFYPPLGNPVIEKAGRLGTGALAAGLGENGTVYNHGAQGFLLRAAATAKRRDLLEDILKYALPYDQQRHPVKVTKSEPYGIVNYYMETQHNFGEGGMPFLSGTISTLFRAIFENMFGVRLGLEHFAISPCMPEQLLPASLTTEIRGKKVEITIHSDCKEAVVNHTAYPFGAPIPYDALNGDVCNVIEVF